MESITNHIKSTIKSAHAPAYLKTNILERVTQSSSGRISNESETVLFRASPYHHFLKRKGVIITSVLAIVIAISFATTSQITQSALTYDDIVTSIVVADTDATDLDDIEALRYEIDTVYQLIASSEPLSLSNYTNQV